MHSNEIALFIKGRKLQSPIPLFRKGIFEIFIKISMWIFQNFAKTGQRIWLKLAGIIAIGDDYLIPVSKSNPRNKAMVYLGRAFSVLIFLACTSCVSSCFCEVYSGKNITKIRRQRRSDLTLLLIYFLSKNLRINTEGYRFSNV
jgi:hypothetical protein